MPSNNLIPCYPPSPHAISVSQHQGLLQWVSSSHQVAKVFPPKVPPPNTITVGIRIQHIDIEKEMTTHSSILAWRIPWTEEPGGLQKMGSQEWNTTYCVNDHTNTHARVLIHFYLYQYAICCKLGLWHNIMLLMEIKMAYIHICIYANIYFILNKWLDIVDTPIRWAKQINWRFRKSKMLKAVFME